MTVKELAAECARLGAGQLTVSALTNIERGQGEQGKGGRPRTADTAPRRRRDVSYAELLVLARALRIPAVLLLFPVGAEDDVVEALPGHQVNAWTALRWFMGDERSEEYDPDGPLTGDRDEWQAATAPIKLSRSHDNLLGEYEWAITESGLFNLPENDPERLRQQVRAEYLLRSVRSVRAQMRRHGMKPPALAEHLGHVDDKRHVWLTPEQAAGVEAEHPGALTMVVYRPED